MKYNKVKKNLSKGNIILKKVDIEGNVCGEFVEFTINHIYENKGNDDLRAVYCFPIPDTAVISGFEVNLGGSLIKGKVQNKDDVDRICENISIDSNEKLKLEELSKDNLKISLGTILKGEKVSIKISYIEELFNYRNQMKLTIPKVIPPVNISDGNIHNGNNQYDISLNLIIESFEKNLISCDTHPIKVEGGESNIYKVTLKENIHQLDKEMIIFLKEEMPVEASGMIYEDYKSEGGIVYLKFLPDVEGSIEEKKGNYIFLLDISNSMEGHKMKEAKTALQLCIRNLNTDDKFNIVAMGDKLSYFSQEGLVPFNNNNLISASTWIEKLVCENNALIFEGIKYSFERSIADGDNTVIIFTDDVVDDEKEIFDYVYNSTVNSRIFPFGIDASVNTYFINKIARLTGGKAEYINKGKRIEDGVLSQFNRIRGLQITNIEIDWGRMEIDKTYPRTIEYMYDGEPFSIFAKVKGDLEGVVTLNGFVQGKRVQRRVILSKLDLAINADLIEKIWYKKRIESLENRIIYERDEVYEAMRNKIIELSTEMGIISNETTYILIEENYEPILGGVMRRFLPANINFNNECGSKISSFYYSQSLENIDLEQLKWDEISKEELMRIIATKQLADGDFSYSVDSSEKEKILYTAEAIIAFTKNDMIIDIYRNLLTKGVRYILDNYSNYTDDKDILAFTYYAINEVNSKLLIKDKQRVVISEALNNLSSLMEKDNIDILKIEEIIINRINKDREENILSELICNLIN